MINVELLEELNSECGYYLAVGPTVDGDSSAVYFNIPDTEDLENIATQSEHLTAMLKKERPRSVKAPQAFVSPDNVADFIAGRAPLNCVVVGRKFTVMDGANAVLETAVPGVGLMIVDYDHSLPDILVNGNRRKCLGLSVQVFGH